MRALAAAGIIAAVLVADGRAEAQASIRVVLVSPPADLEAAVRTALAPWRVTIIVERGERPRDAASAAEVAARHRASAVVWVDVGAMRVFEPRAAELVARPVDEIDDASAASLALTVKTLLRLPALPPEGEPPPPPAPVVVVTAPPAPPLRPWRVSAAVGGRARSEGIDPRLTVDVERRLGPVALALSGSVGPGHDVASGSYRGTWRDTVAAAAVRVPLERAGWRFAVGVGASVHVMTLDGAFQGNNDAPADHDDLGLGVDGELEAGRQWGRIGAGVRVCGSVVSFRDRVEAQGANAIEVAPGEGEIAVFGAFSF